MDKILYEWVNEKPNNETDMNEMFLCIIKENNPHKTVTYPAYVQWCYTGWRTEGKFTVVEWLKEVQPSLTNIDIVSVVKNYWEYATKEAGDHNPNDIEKGAQYREGIFKGIHYILSQQPSLKEDEWIKKLPSDRELEVLENAILAADPTCMDVLIKDLRRLITKMTSKIRKVKSINNE